MIAQAPPVYDPLKKATERVDEQLACLGETLQAAHIAESQHTEWRTRRNERVLTVLRALELFGGHGACPVCGSPPKWKAGKKPTDKERQDLHDDKCELDVSIRHFEHCLRAPGLW